MRWKQSAPRSLNANPGARTQTGLPANSACGCLGHPQGSNEGKLYVGWMKRPGSWHNSSGMLGALRAGLL